MIFFVSCPAAMRANTKVATLRRRRLNILRTLARAMRVTPLLILFAIVGPALYAQSPAADWRTIETAHFHVHFPREYEQWATRAASRLESIREAVSKEVGFTPAQVVDVVVMNPIAEANGSAWPLLKSPRMIFYAEPPGPDESIGNYTDWIDLLAIHEYAHTAHMLRPSRNPLERALVPFDPIVFRAPRWVLEGYATVIEGRLTGAGRPNGTFRALLLRRWAEAGRLPSYGELDASRKFFGGSMAYLMGSAFLEWLEQKRGPDSLRNLWLRLTARHRRSFDEAFTGVFGDRADRLYGRFLAELTTSAIELDRARTLQEGELFQETSRNSGEPAVSPDGKQIGIVIRDRDQPDKLVIWSTGEPAEEEKKFKERVEKILERDPEDVGPLREKPLPRKAIHTLILPDGGDINTPRWMPDGKSILFSHRAPDAEGFLHFDLYRWDFENVTRVTHLADVREADPYPDGVSAVAVQSRYGITQLATVHLADGSLITATSELPSYEVIYTHPRVSRDGRFAYVAHTRGEWTLFVDGKPVPLPGDASSPEWMGSSVIATVAKGGFAELHRDGVIITTTRGGAFDPAPSPDGRIFFMSLDPDGYVLRVLPANTNAATFTPPPAPFAPIPPHLVTQSLPKSHAYGLGRQEFSWFAGTNVARGHRALEAGARLGDVVGRLDTLLIASIGSGNAPEGVALASTWRGWPIELQAHAFRTDDDTGIELRARWTHYRLALESGRLARLRGADETSALLFANASYSLRHVFGSWRIEESLRVDVDDAHQRGILGASLRSGSFRIAAQVQHDRGDELVLGGLASSILPRSAYAHRILDPALPVAALRGSDYDGWRIESTVPGLPFTAFYQRHELGGARLSVYGLEAELHSDPFPILKLPALGLTAGVARANQRTNWWLGMRWRP
ncbi:MAG: hypothetical protein DMF56_18570 [Acidobacteria bacterium]|nr:MAG: hypothetical protein DMF56_18570 [Acidobacteriota bacterium]